MSTTYDTPAQGPTTQEPTTRERRPVRVGYLVSGLVLLGLVATWALWTVGLVSAPALGFLVPAVLVVAGGVGILALLLTAARRRRTSPPARPTDVYDQTGDDQTDTDQFDTHQTDNETEEIR